MPLAGGPARLILESGEYEDSQVLSANRWVFSAERDPTVVELFSRSLQHISPR